MLKRSTWIALPLAFTAAGLGASGASAASAKPVACEIRVSDAGAGRQLTAVASAASAISASYQLDMNAASAGGNANTSQGDDVSLAPGETVLSTTTVGPGAKYTAKLTVTWTGGSTSCSKQG